MTFGRCVGSASLLAAGALLLAHSAAAMGGKSDDASDENGDPVIGAAVHWESFVDGEIWYDYNTTTFKYAGYNHGESCPIEVAQASGATGQNCCIGNATDPPEDSRSCATGW